MLPLGTASKEHVKSSRGESHGAVVASRPGDRKVPGSNPSSGGGDFEK